MFTNGVNLTGWFQAPSPQGQLLNKLVDGHHEKGEHELPWESADTDDLQAGIYFVEFRTGTSKVVKKLVKQM
jgi:hypothetical protein